MLYATLLFVIGFMVPLLLNGQTFTNSIIGIGCFGGSAAICVLSDQTTRKGVGYVTRPVMAGLAVLLIVLLVVQLPANYKFQERFNHLRQGANAAIAPTDPQELNP